MAVPLKRPSASVQHVGVLDAEHAAQQEPAGNRGAPVAGSAGDGNAVDLSFRAKRLGYTAKSGRLLMAGNLGLRKDHMEVWYVVTPGSTA